MGIRYRVWLEVGSGDLNPGPHIYMVRLLPTEPSLETKRSSCGQFVFCLRRKSLLHSQVMTLLFFR